MGPPSGWCTLLHEQAPSLARVFQAFGAPSHQPACAPATLEAWVASARAGLSAAITATLTGEVDADQAAMFARRCAAVDTLLGRIDQPLLRAALVARASEILAAPPPRALRIRALADFYYSQAARLHHQAHTPPRALQAVVAAAAWRPIGEDLEHATLTGPGPAGPVHINVLRGASTGLRCVHVQGPPRPLPDIVRAGGALAGVSGGFFLYSEPHIAPPLSRRLPVGVLVSDGAVVSGPDFRRATLWQDDAGVHIGRGGPVGWTVRIGERQVRVSACNAQAAAGPTWFNAAYGPRAPRAGLQICGTTAQGLGDQTHLLGGVLVAPGLPDHHGPVQWTPPCGWQQAMAGGPMLLGPGPCLDLVHEDFAAGAPPITFSRDETYDENLLPRMAAGLDARDRVVFAAIDGRNFERAPGFTLRMTAELMRALGCTRAMNLDGGSSKRMAIGDRCVDLASTEVVSTGEKPVRVRKVVSAILLGRAR